MPKKRIFITSTGRTATQFFAKYLNEMIEHSVSLHEPGTPWFSKPKKLLAQVGQYGLYHLSFGQGDNRNSMYKLSRDFIAGDITKEDACHNILMMNNLVDSFYPEAEVLVYSSGHIYGLLGLLDELYEDSRFVLVVRDPRDWIGSALKKIEYSLYGPIEIFFRKISLQPSCFGDDPYLAQWHSMSKFEKYCWFYNKLNTHVIAEMQGKPNFKAFKYEDILKGADKVVHFNEMLDFAVDFESGKVTADFHEEALDQKVDSKQSTPESWHSWTPEQAQLMMKHCGSFMKEYGYGNEPDWVEKVGAVSV